MKHVLTLDLQLFAEDGEYVETGVDDVSAAEIQEETEVEAAPETKEPVEKAFAKRLAAERSKWESETSEKYKDYDVYRKATEYLQKTSGIDDVMTLKEQLEMTELQERAEQQNVPPEVLKRLDELEQKAARGDELEQQQQRQQMDNLFWSTAEKFCEGKDVSKEDLNKFMLDNDISVDLSDLDKANRKFELAYKAMNHDIVVKKAESAEKDGMKKLIGAKGSISTIPGKSPQGQVVNAPPKTFAEARQRAMQRMNGEI